MTFHHNPFKGRPGLDGGGFAPRRFAARTIASRGLVPQIYHARCLGRDLAAFGRTLPERRPDADGDVA